jgi:hypothetical protein
VTGNDALPGRAHSRRTRWLLAVGLVIVAPLSAEYIIGYDTSTGRPLALLGGLLIFAPLYGAPALLIRELARRRQIPWSGIVALAIAAGIVEAGIIDQSMFSESYRQIDYWEAQVGPTWIGLLGLSASSTLQFIAGHAIWSFSVPIALIEGLRPGVSAVPWLGRPGLVVASLLYLAAAGLVLSDHLRHEQDHASGAQVGGAAAVAVLLIIFALTRGGRERRVQAGTVPPPVVLAVGSLLASGVFLFASESWLGFALAAAVLLVSGLAVAVLSRSTAWNSAHVVALAAGALLARAVLGFFVDPLGDVSAIAKYAHNLTFLAGALVLGLCAGRANRQRVVN